MLIPSCPNPGRSSSGLDVRGFFWGVLGRNNHRSRERAHAQTRARQRESEHQSSMERASVEHGSEHRSSMGASIGSEGFRNSFLFFSFLFLLII